MKKIRCSNLPRNMMCPYSAFKKKDFLSPNNNALTGTIAHECIAEIIRSEGDTTTIINNALRINMVKDENLIKNIKRHVWGMREMWLSILDSIEEMGLEIKSIQVECSAKYDNPKLSLTGTCDVIIQDKNNDLIIIDWKTGVQDDCTDQLLGYAFMNLGNNPEANKVYAIAAYSEDKDYYVNTFERDQVDYWFKKVVDRLCVDESKRLANPSPESCKYCPIRWSCNERTKYIELVERMALTYNDNTAQSQIELIADLRNKLDMCGKIKKDVDNALKTMIAVEGDIFAGGKEYTIQESTRKSIALTSDAQEIIERHSSGAVCAILNTVKVSPSKLKDYKNSGAFMKELEDNGFVESKIVESIKVKKG